MTGQINPCMYIVLLPSYLFLQFRISVSVLASVISNQSSYLHFVCQGQRHETVAVWLKAQDRSRDKPEGTRGSSEDRVRKTASSIRVIYKCRCSLVRPP